MNKDLKRYPVIKNDPLQAWDSADELILEEVSKGDLKGKRILVINDAFGALSSNLEGLDVTSYTDSFVSARAANINGQGKVSCICDLMMFTGIYDYVLIRIPKNSSFFEDILCHLTHHIDPHTRIICGSMVKHLSKSAFDLLQRYIGETSTSLAQKKARLVFASVQKDKAISPYPLKVRLDGFDKEFINYSNLFSREKLDVGTRFMLEHIPRGPFESILDLGCGNGVLGIRARQLNPGAHMIFSDESYMAILSARINYSNYFEDEAQFLWTNCFESGGSFSADLVLCNPPFHQQTTIGDFIAWQMFNDAFRALRNGGKLRVIGNSHLGYQYKLKKIFGNSDIVATNQKFMIIDSVK